MKTVVCPDCAGTGAVAGDVDENTFEKCERCQGEGEISTEEEK